MYKMNGRERIANLLNHKKTDRIGVYEAFWNDTHKKYAEQGKIKPDESLIDHFGLDIRESWAFDLTLDLDFIPEIIEETEETVLVKDGNGAILRRHKKHEATPEHVGFTINNCHDWLEVRDMLVNVDFRRINFKGYREEKEKASRAGHFFVWGYEGDALKFMSPCFAEI